MSGLLFAKKVRDGAGRMPWALDVDVTARSWGKGDAESRNAGSPQTRGSRRSGAVKRAEERQNGSPYLAQPVDERCVLCGAVARMKIGSNQRDAADPLRGRDGEAQRHMILVAARKNAEPPQAETVGAGERFAGQIMRCKFFRRAERNGGRRQRDKSECAGKMVEEARSFRIIEPKTDHGATGARLPFSQGEIRRFDHSFAPARRKSGMRGR
jgi:hypothetical protein